MIFHDVDCRIASRAPSSSRLCFVPRGLCPDLLGFLSDLRPELSRVGPELCRLGGEPSGFELVARRVPETCEQRSHLLAIILVEFRQDAESLWRCLADGQHTEAVAMKEGEGRIRGFEFLPEAPDPEALLAHPNVVEEDNAATARLGKPSIEVMPHNLVGMAAIDMQEIDAPSVNWPKAWSKSQRTRRENRA